MKPGVAAAYALLFSSPARRRNCWPLAGTKRNKRRARNDTEDIQPLVGSSSPPLAFYHPFFCLVTPEEACERLGGLVQPKQSNNCWLVFISFTIFCWQADSNDCFILYSNKQKMGEFDYLEHQSFTHNCNIPVNSVFQMFNSNNIPIRWRIHDGVCIRTFSPMFKRTFAPCLQAYIPTSTLDLFIWIPHFLHHHFNYSSQFSYYQCFLGLFINLEI